jgi:hypothetical protein
VLRAIVIVRTSFRPAVRIVHRIAQLDPILEHVSPSRLTSPSAVTDGSTAALRRVLVVGKSSAVQEKLSAPLAALGALARFSTDFEHADALFDAREFDLIVFGYGVVGPISARLRGEFGQRNPDVSFLDAFAPVAIRQIAAELARGGKSQDMVSDFRVIAAGSDLLLRANLRRPCSVRIEVHREPGAPPPSTELIDESAAATGSLERRIDAEQQIHGHMLVMTLDDREFFLFRMKAVS